MNEPSPSEESLRHFLLGKVPEAERVGIERLFLTDAQYKERLLAAEQSLIDDYLEERLTTDDRESFLSQYAATPDQQRKLRIARSIKEHAEAQAVLRPIDVALNRKRKRPSGVRAKSGLILRIAAVVIVALILTIWVLSRRNQPGAQHLAIERELATLNDPSRLRETLPQMAALSVAPITLRNIQTQPHFALRSDVSVLELHLLLVPNERHEKYRAVLQNAANSEEFTVPELAVEGDKSRLIRLRIPTSILSPGDYKIRLSSTSPDGDGSSVEEYNFSVGG